MTRCKPVWPLLVATILALLLAACDDGGGAKPTPTGAVTQAPTSRPAATGTAPAAPTSAAPTETATQPTTTPVASPSSSPPLSLGPRVDFDMDSAGNSCPNNGSDCTIGPIQECVSVPNAAGATFNVDVVMTGLNNGFTLFNYNIYYPDTQLKLTRQTHTDPLVNLVTQSIGSNVSDLSESAPPGSPLLTNSPHHVGTMESGTSETTPPFTQGVLGRYEFTVAEGAASGLYDVTLERPPLSAYLDQYGESYLLDPVTTGLVALGQPCP